MVILPDLLEPGLKIVFCGTAASPTSAAVGAYYAGPGNRFWPALYEVGLTPTQFEPSDYPRLLDYAIGLTDLAKHESGVDRALSHLAFDVPTLRQKIEMYQPRVLAFTSKTGGKAFMGHPVEYGLQPESLGRTMIYVLPSTSGAAIAHWDISYWQALADLYKTL